MKNEIKKMLLVISILYSVIIVILMLFSFFRSTNTYEFNDTSENIQLLKEYKEKLNSIEDSTCKKSVVDLVNHYEETSYNGKVNLSDKLLNEKALLGYALNLFNDCNLSSEVKEKIGTKILAASIQFDEVLQKLYFQYEITLPDIYNRILSEPQLNGVRYSINRKLQLEIIEEMIEVLQGDSNNE